MYDNYDHEAWRTDEQLMDESLKRVFGIAPKTDAKFEALLDKLKEVAGRQDDETAK